MDNDKKNGDQDKGFVVRDKRFSAKKEGEEDSRIKDEEEKREEAKQEDVLGQDAPLPEINFSSLIFSLSTSVLIQLGEIQDQNTQQPAKNLLLAKQTIDLIGMLKEKTKGNLTSDEEKLLENILYDLRLRYVKAVG
jgi:hypothetical protein